MTISIPDTLTTDNSEKYIVSIRLRSGGLSFSGYDPSAGGSFFYRETEFDRAVSFISSLKEFFFAHEFLTWTYKRINVICVSPEYSLVPDNYWGDGKEGHLLDFCFSTLELHCLTDILKEQQAKLVFGVDEEVYEFCSRSLLHPFFSHYMTSPLTLWTKESSASLPRQMYVVIERKRMDVACYAQGKLLFVNSHPIDQSDDIVYYILYVWKQAGLNQEKDQLLLAGESSSRMRVLERLRTYLRHVKPVEIPSEAYLQGTDVTKVPMDLISLLICE